MSDDQLLATTSGAGFVMRQRDPEQPSLFAPEDLVVPSAVKELRKAVSAIHATPLGHSQSLNGRRLFDACILVAQLDFRSRSDPRALMERVRVERVCPVFETRVTDLARLAGIPGKNHTRIYQELDELFDLKLAWNIVGEDSSVEWQMKSHFLSSLGYGNGEKRGLIRFSIDPYILEIILEPKNWATLSCRVMGELRTAASYSLYQNAFRYVNTHAKVTAALPVAVWAELLIGSSRYVVEDEKGSKKLVNYGDFKRRVLVDALRRVNDCPALAYALELKEIKSGQRVVKLQFKFIPKQQPSLGIPLTWPADIVSALESSGFGVAEVEDLSQSYSIEEVAEGLNRLAASSDRLRKAGKSITSRKSYLLGILSNIAQGASSEDVDHDKLVADAQQQDLQRAAEARQQRLVEEFNRHQTDCVAQWLFGLPSDLRDELLAHFAGTNDGQKAQVLVRKGWTPTNVGALTLLKGWIISERRDLSDQIFLRPEDRVFSDWMAWRLTALERPI